MIKVLDKTRPQQELNGHISALQEMMRAYMSENPQKDFRMHANLLGLGIVLYYLQSEHDFTEFLEVYSGEEYQEIVFSLCPQFLQYFVVALLH